MHRTILKIIIAILIFFSQSKDIENNITKVKNVSNTVYDKYNFKEIPIGSLTIKKINFHQEIYDLNSKNNTIEKNIAILPGSIEPTYSNSIIFIAAHSGSGKVAFFKNLDKLEVNDKITLKYKNKDYIYYVNKIWEQKKSSSIDIYKEKDKQLILTTCSPSNKDKQLIISSIIKES